jgi:hypothetical protein
VNTAEDPSGNIASCTFFFAVVPARATDRSSASASTGAMIAGGAGGGIALIVLLVVVVLLFMRRNYRRVRCWCLVCEYLRKQALIVERRGTFWSLAWSVHG